MTRILHMGDLHFGAVADGLVEGLLALTESLRPDVIAVAGDLTQHGRREEFQAAREFFLATGRPVVATPGNHDTPLLGMGHRLLNPWGRFRRHLGDAVSTRWTDDITAIDTFPTARGVQLRLDWSLGRADRHAVRDVAGRLERTGRLRRIAMCHHPIVSPLEGRGLANTKGAARAAAILIDQEVDLVLSGHLHTPFISVPPAGDGHTAFIGAGTALSTRVREDPPGVNLIELDAADGQVETYAFHEGRYAVSTQTRLMLRERG